MIPTKGKGDGQRQSIDRNNNKPGICSFKYVWVLKKTVSCWSSTIAVTGYLQICYNIVLFGNCSSLHIICRNCVYTFLFLQLIYFHSPIEISSSNDTTLLSLQQHIMVGDRFYSSATTILVDIFICNITSFPS